MLRGVDRLVSKKTSMTKIVNFNQEAIQAFKIIKSSLIPNEVILEYPDFRKEFHLTTDASNFAIGAVLSQNNQPISFISRTLSKAEENYAANEKEMLAIVRALKALRNYLYGSAKEKIFTDHQALSLSLSNWNGNPRIKRPKVHLEEFDYELLYKPGKDNIVADALSRITNPNELNSISSVSTQHSDESSSHNLKPSVKAPINVFKNQIFIHKAKIQDYKLIIPLPRFHRHDIYRQNYDSNELTSILKKYLNPSVINGTNTTEDIMGKLESIYPTHFNNFKIRFSQKIVQVLKGEEKQEEETHNRAHRNASENKTQLSETF